MGYQSSEDHFCLACARESKHRARLSDTVVMTAIQKIIDNPRVGRLVERYDSEGFDIDAGYYLHLHQIKHRGIDCWMTVTYSFLGVDHRIIIHEFGTVARVEEIFVPQPDPAHIRGLRIALMLENAR
jgi:hypothetical protein